MTEKKVALLSLKNLEKVKVRTEKINKLLKNIPMDNLTKWSNLCRSKIDKIGIFYGTQYEIQNLDGKWGWKDNERNYIWLEISEF